MVRRSCCSSMIGDYILKITVHTSNRGLESQILLQPLHARVKRPLLRRLYLRIRYVSPHSKPMLAALKIQPLIPRRKLGIRKYLVHLGKVLRREILIKLAAVDLQRRRGRRDVFLAPRLVQQAGYTQREHTSKSSGKVIDGCEVVPTLVTPSTARSRTYRPDCHQVYPRVKQNAGKH